MTVPWSDVEAALWADDPAQRGLLPPDVTRVLREKGWRVVSDPDTGVMAEPRPPRRNRATMRELPLEDSEDS